MQHLNNTPASTLYWIQPRWGKPEFELRSNDELFCTLRWSTYSVWNPISVISADGQWTLISQWPRTVRIISSDYDVALSESGWPWLTRIVEFANGRRFHWRRNFWQTQCTFSGEGTDNLLLFKAARIWPFKMKVRVDLAQRVKDLPEASLLAALGLYLLFLVWFANQGLVKGKQCP